MSLLKVALSCALLQHLNVSARLSVDEDEEPRRSDQSYYKDNKG